MARREEFAKGVGIISQAILKKAELDVERQHKREERAADFEERWKLFQRENEWKARIPKDVFRETDKGVERIGEIPSGAELLKRADRELSPRDASIHYKNDPNVINDPVLGPKVRSALDLPPLLEQEDDLTSDLSGAGIFGGPLGGIFRAFGGVPSGQPKASGLLQQPLQQPTIQQPQVPQPQPGQLQVGEERVLRGKRYRFHGLDPTTGERLWEEVP